MSLSCFIEHGYMLQALTINFQGSVYHETEGLISSMT